jgi:hypothetical protein
MIARRIVSVLDEGERLGFETTPAGIELNPFGLCMGAGSLALTGEVLDWAND